MRQNMPYKVYQQTRNDKIEDQMCVSRAKRRG